MAPRKGKEKKEEQVISLGPQVAEGENVFGVCHIFASFNDTFVHVTDLSGKYVTQECGKEYVCFIKYIYIFFFIRSESRLGLSCSRIRHHKVANQNVNRYRVQLFLSTFSVGLRYRIFFSFTSRGSLKSLNYKP